MWWKNRGNAAMTIYSVSIGLLLALPWCLVGVIFLGTATATIRRWLESCQW
jgi:hypothetical protein